MLVESKYLIKNPEVSVVVLAYNHEQYLTVCLDNILNQSFVNDYEIIIAEDCSQDATREICYEYYKQYPHKIRLLFQETNQGLLANYRDAMALCRGKYIAQCAGDDYWCDRDKLKLQYEYLESNKDFGFIRTLGYELRNNILVETHGGHACNIGDVRNIAIWGPLGYASSIFFDRMLLSYVDFNELIIREISMEDYPMHAIFAYHTKFALIEKPMVVYRIMSESVSHSKHYEKKMKYLIGYSKCKIFLKDMFGESIPWSISEVEDDINYKKLRYSYLKFDYRDARKIKFVTKKYDSSYLVVIRNNVILFYILAILLRLKQQIT